MKQFFKMSIFALGLLIISCEKTNTEKSSTEELVVDWSEIDFDFKIDFETQLALDEVDLKVLSDELASEIYAHDFQESRLKENLDFIAFTIEFTASKILINPLLENIEITDDATLLYTCFDEVCLKKALNQSMKKHANQSTTNINSLLLVSRNLEASYVFKKHIKN